MLKDIFDLIKSNARAEEKRRAKLTFVERFKEDYPDNIIAVISLSVATFVFGFLPLYGLYHLVF